MKRFTVGILGATGLVGQRLVQRLAAHPWFDLAVLAASDRSVGRAYGEAAPWRLAGDPPPAIAESILAPCTVDALGDCDLALSALDGGPASTIEPQLAAAGLAVVSNSSAHRMDADVPLLVPEVNAEHLDLARRHRERGTGFIVTNPNCSVTGLAIALAPLDRAFGVRRAIVATMQAISGAGARGPYAFELHDNVIPYIPGEEDKLERELQKILGAVGDGGVRSAGLAVSAHCHRVATLDGHLEAVSLETERPASVEEAIERLDSWAPAAELGPLPSLPAQTIVVRREADRPQPRLDRDTGGGMSVVVGRIRPCPVLGLKFELLSHNAIRGAAGGTLLNAELLAHAELLERR